MRSSHMLLCASLVVLGVALFAGGLGAFTFVPLAACMLMMGVMMWMMMGSGRNDRGSR